MFPTFKSINIFLKQKIMKKLFAVLVISMFCFAAFAQTAPKYVYCDIIGYNKMLSNKVTVKVDFGEHTKAFADNRMKDPQTGKAKVFNSMVDALNFMSKYGWEFEQAYTVLVGEINYQHYLMKKPFTELDEASQAEIMKE